ncbi:8834_t:CDS:2 [Ambispora gerdemannii]|uniref:Multiple inositol polyphosphate phosphatase 1 n=1 Tax=Ambispora gerdemannii TaxID=144530 RepID=A0A9N9E2Q4_9GLOM|nr:8834_t:CDS:2 [Ambispora gerdemannii]
MVLSVPRFIILVALFSNVFWSCLLKHEILYVSSLEVIAHIGTKRPYPIVTDTSPPLQVPENCELKQLHLVSRHAGDIIKFDVLKILFASFSHDSEEMSWIKSWKNPFKISSAGLLSHDGEKELYLMGKRSKSRYREFWENITYASNLVDFSSSAAPRSGQSGFAYALGLFEGQGSLGNSSLQSVYIHTEPTGLDKELAMKKACPKWLSTVARRKNHEIVTYIKEKLSPIADRINQKLGITPPLEPIHVDYIHRACGFEVAFFRNTTTWCSLLTDTDLLTMEYFNDIQHYYLYSYGNRLNSLLACQLITSFVHAVDDGLAGKSEIKSVLRFAHAETIYFLMTLLNMNKDEHLLKANDPQKKIASHDDKNDRTQLFCPWSKFKKILDKVIGCDFEGICRIKKRVKSSIQEKHFHFD